MHQELCLELYLSVEDFGAFIISLALAEGKQDADEDDYGGEGSAHFMSHIFVSDLQFFNLAAGLIVTPLQFVI